MRYITPYTNFGGVRCGLFVGLARLNDLLRITVSLKDKDRKEENIINLVLEVLRILINLLD